MWRVLVVDDEPALREVLKVALELEGYEVRRLRVTVLRRCGF